MTSPLQIFSTLFIEIIPLLMIIAVGLFAGRKLEMSMHSLSVLSLYIIGPFVTTVSLSHIDLNLEYIAVPILFYFVASGLALLAFKMGQWALDKDYHPIMPLIGGTSNCGYFGIPIVVALWGMEAIGLYILFNASLLAVEVTTSYYLSVRTHSSFRESLKRILKLPPFYALIIGIGLNILNIPIPNVVNTYWEHATGAYIIIGMMLIGVGLSKLEHFKLNIRFTSLALLHKYVIWTAVFLSLILIDKNVTGFLDAKAHTLIFIMAICPLAANSVAYAIQLKLHAQETAGTVLLSTALALVYVPLALSLYIFIWGMN